MTILSTIFYSIHRNKFWTIINSNSIIKRDIVLDSVRFSYHGATRSLVSKFGQSKELPNRTIILNKNFKYRDTLKPISIWYVDNVRRLKQCKNEDRYPFKRDYFNLISTFLLFFSPFYAIGVYGIFKSLTHDE